MLQYDYFSSDARHRRSVVSFRVAAVRSLLPYFSTYRMSYRQFPSPFSEALARSVMRRGAARLTVFPDSFSTRATELAGLVAGLYSVVCDSCFVAGCTVCRNDVIRDRQKRL